MNKMKCELCGSTDFMKEDGVFACQYCGTKYSPEEAKKMMIEGTVDVQGTVKVDNSSFVQKSLANARRAMQKEDWEEVEKYYNLVEQNDPKNIEAIFYSSYGKARLSMVDGDIYKRQQICDVLCNSISVIDDNYDVEKSEENQEIIQKMGLDLWKMYCTSFVYTERTDDITKTYHMFAKMAFCFIDSLQNIIKIDDQLIYWKLIYEQEKYLASNQGVKLEARKEYRQKALDIANQIHEKDTTFEVETIPEPKITDGCYVATAVYGSYDCPEVWTLRRYRDYDLAETWHGRVFIHTYYAVSPTLVKWFGHTEWFKNMWKGKLDRMVKNLQAKGYEDTPYEDRKW